MSTGNTISVSWPPVVNASYETIANSWTAPFENISDSGWIPYLDFGDLTSLLYADSSVYDPWFNLWNQSCWDGDIQNCTSVCQNATLLFANTTIPTTPEEEKSLKLDTRVPYNILTCMYYPVLSKLLGLQLQQNDSTHALQAIGAQYHIVPNASTELVQSIVDVQVDCYQDFCFAQSENLCDKYDFDTGTYQGVTAPGVLPLFPDWSTISPDSTMNINSDIGGIGVSIAYIVEFGIIVAVWLVLRLLRLIQHWKSSPRSNHQDGQELPDVDSLALNPLQDAGPTSLHRTQKMRADLVQLLTDFQQAQCWFFIPLNLTILLGLSGSTSVFGTTSLGQLARNMAYAQCVTQGGIVLTITTLYFVLFEIHFCYDAFEKDKMEGTVSMSKSSKRLSRFARQNIQDPRQILALWILTFIAVALGTTAWVISFHIDKPARLIDAQVGSYQLYWTRSCGSISPATYNGELWNSQQWTHKNHMGRRLPIIIFNWVLLTGMLVYFLRKHFTSLGMKSHIIRNFLNWLATFSRQHLMRRIVLCLSEIFVLTCLGFFMNDYVELMRPDLPQIDKTFTMGQLLATFVWATTILSAAYMIWDWIVATPATGSGDPSSGQYYQMNDNLDQDKQMRIRAHRTDSNKD